MKTAGAEKVREKEIKTLTEALIKAILTIIEKSETKEEAVEEIKKLLK